MSIGIDISIILYLIVPGALLGWLFRRIGFLDVTGFIIGGLLSYFILSLVNIDIEKLHDYTVILQLIGLILFFFEVGASLDLRRITKSIYIVASSELVLLLLAWVVTGIISLVVNFDVVQRLALFLLMVNSSTIGVMALHKSTTDKEIRERAVLQTSLEDLLQIVFFGMFVSAMSIQEQLLHIMVNLLNMAGKALALFIVIILASRILSKSPFVVNRTDKFFTLITLAISFSTIASIIGLPELFGALLAGLGVSIYFKLDDVLDLLSGLKTLGLLFYFTSIGLLIAPWLQRVSMNSIILAVILTAMIMSTRILGCFIGFSISGVGVYNSAILSLVLSSISETGIIFTYMLFVNGVVSGDFIITGVFSVLLSILMSSIIIPRAYKIAAIIESRLPRGVARSLDMFSKIYRRRIEVFINTLSILTWFTAVSLLITGATSILGEISRAIKLPAITNSIVSAISIVLILLLHIASVKRLSNIMVKYMRNDVARRPMRILESAIDLLMGVLAVILQVYIFSDFINKQLQETPLIGISIVYIAFAVTMVVTIYNAINQYIKYSWRERSIRSAS